VTDTAVIQVKPGIGDVIWHLPFIRAIAAAAPGGCVTFLAPPRSGARELLAAEQSVAETLYFRHDGNELMRGVRMLSLAARLRRGSFRQIWILDRTLRPAIAATLAGIPERIGLGLGSQRFFITNPGIDQRYYHDHPINWLIALMAAMNVPVPSLEPDLQVPLATSANVAQKFQSHLRPWIVLGTGASHPDKEWSFSSWLELLSHLRRKCRGTIFLVGGEPSWARSESLIKQTIGTTTVNACDLQLIEAVALLRMADLFIGVDSGPMNLAVAGGTEAFGLFGATPALKYSKLIHPIVPEGGFSPDGMKAISPAAVLEQVEPLLSRVKESSIPHR